MKKALRTLAAAVLIAGVTACASMSTPALKEENFSRITPGMTTADVVTLLGGPPTIQLKIPQQKEVALGWRYVNIDPKFLVVYVGEDGRVKRYETQLGPMRGF